MPRSSRVLLLLLAVLVAAPAAYGTTIDTTNTGDFLLVGRGPTSSAVGVKVGSSNSLGRIYSVPSGSDPDVSGVPWPPANGGVGPTANTTTNDGNVAVTHAQGTYDFSDIDVWADIGIRCENGVQARCEAQWDNSTLTGGNFANDSSLMGDIDQEMNDAAMAISVLSSTNGWALTSGAGSKNGSGQWVVDSDGVDENTLITLDNGLNVIEIVNTGIDFKINGAGLVVDGPSDAQVIFVLTDESKKFDFANASILIGGNGIGTDAIVFAMVDGSAGGTGTKFSFSNVIVNGASYWDFTDMGEITLNNVQGCGQWTADALNFNDVQLARCAFAGVPEPRTAPLAAAAILGLLAFAAYQRRRA